MEKLKKILNDWIIVVMLIFFVLAVVFAILSSNGTIFARISFVFWAIGFVCVSYKFYLRYKSQKKMQEQLEEFIFANKPETSKLQAQIQDTTKEYAVKINLLYSICSAVLAIVLFIYVFR